MTKPGQGGPIPALGWVVLGAVAAAAIVALVAALWLRLPAPVRKPAPVPATPVLPLDLPYLPLPSLPLSPTEVPPATEPAPALPAVEVTTTRPVSPPPAAASPYPAGPGRLVLVIDDMGMDVSASMHAMAVLPPPVVFAFMAEAPATPALARQAKAAGHPLLAHVPMEPLPHPEGTPPLGALGLQVGMDSATLVAQVRANVAPLAGLIEGANNHMGSRFTQWEAGMATVLAELAAQGLYFLDSRTAAPTASAAVAPRVGVPLAQRDVFLDHVPTVPAVRAQLQRAARLAQQRGPSGRPVVVIGHPLPATLTVLAADLPRLAEAGLTLVPLQAALR